MATDGTMAPWSRHLTAADREALAAWLQLSKTPLSAVEAQRLQAWLEVSPHRQAAFSALRDTWEDPDMELALAAADLSPLLMRSGLGSPRMTRRVLVGGAALAVPAAVGGMIWSSRRSEFEETFTTATGVTREVSLPDGSALMLNAMTDVSVRMDASRRRLVLGRGEAFLRLVQGPPMVWTCGEVQIEATACEVNLNRLGALNVVLVSSGAATVTFEGRNLVLGAGQGVEAQSGRALTRLNTSPSAQTWREGWLDVTNASLATVMTQLGRYASKPVSIPDRSLAATPVAGRFALDRFAENLTVLATLCDFRVQDTGGVIVLHPRVARPT